MDIIPAIDIIDGSCVRLTMGDFETKKVYSTTPLEVAKRFEDANIKRLHLIDLDGSRLKSVQNIGVLKSIATHTKLIIDVGGGLHTKEDFQKVFDAGASFATVGSIAITNRDLVTQLLAKWGSDRLILGADSLHGNIAISGWSETVSTPLFDFLTEYLKMGFTTVIATDITKDGMLKGPSFDLYKEIIKHYPSIKLIASGGVSSIEDIKRLSEMGLSAAIVGKALYEGHITLKELRKWIGKKG